MLVIGLGIYVVVVGIDFVFEKYFKDMRFFREEIRMRLDSGYWVFKDVLRSYRSLFSFIYSFIYRVFLFIELYLYLYFFVSYRKCLEDGLED